MSSLQGTANANEGTEHESYGSTAVCLAVRRYLTGGSVYGCFRKHPKTDALVEAL